MSAECVLAIAAIMVGSIALAYIVSYCLGYKSGVKGIVELYKDTDNWIPVDAGLPEEDVRVIVAVRHNNSYTNIDTDRILYGQWVRWEGSVTHWQELPDLPKEGNNERT